MSTPSAPVASQIRSARRWKIGYVAALILVLLVSAVFQFGNIGWLILIFGIFYVAAYLIHLAYWGLMLLLSNRISRRETLFFWASNLSLLVANVLNVDLDDAKSYMFFFQVENPPEWVHTLSVRAWVVWGVVLALDVLLRVIGYLRRRAKEEPGRSG